MKSQAFFTGIQEQLYNEISKAKDSIYLAMAWFTDRLLFQAVLERAMNGVYVYLLLSNDDINKDYGPDFSDLEDHGAEVIWVTVAGGDNVMHNKFCVLDERTTITGSYNWTNRAHSNHENITITWDDIQLAGMFITEFDRLRKLYGGRAVGIPKPFDYGVVSKRLALIRNHLELNEFDEIRLQIDKLRHYELIPDVEDIISLLEKSYYSEAWTAIEALHQRYTAVVSVSLHRLAELRLQIRYLEIEYMSALEQRDLLSRTVGEFRHRVRLALGDLILELLNLKIAWNKIKERPGKAAKLEDLFNQFRNFDEELKKAKQVAKPELDALDETEIRDLYRRGVKLCHPDTTEESQKTRAAEIFIRLKQAFDQNDLKEVRYIVDSLESGVWDLGKGNAGLSEVQKMEAMVLELRLKIEEIRKEIDLLAGSEDYKEYQQCADLEEFLKQQEIILKEQILYFEKKIKEAS